MKKLLLSILSLITLSAFSQWQSTPITLTGIDCYSAFGNLLSSAVYGPQLDVSSNEGTTFASSNTGSPAGGVNFGTYNGGTLCTFKNNTSYQSNTGNNWTALTAGSIGVNDYIKSMASIGGTVFASTSPLSGLGFKIHELNGSTWALRSSNGGTIVTSIHNMNGAMWAGTTAYGLLKSTNAGTSFLPAPGTPTTLTFDRYITCLGATPSALFCGTQGGKVCRSIDGGLTWAGVYNIGNGANSVNINDIYVMNNNTILVACDSGFVYSTSNGALGTWIKDNTGLIKTAGTYLINHITVTANYIIASDKNGVLMRKPISETTIGIKENSLVVIESKVYPNPVTNFATIESSDLIFENNCEVKLNDVLGREVAVFEMKNGKANLNLSNFSKGLYYYNILNNKTVMSKGKLIVN